MNFNYSTVRGRDEAAFVLVVSMALVSIAVTIFWMVVGWRAMIAHERIARALAHMATRNKPQLPTPIHSADTPETAGTSELWIEPPPPSADENLKDWLK